MSENPIRFDDGGTYERMMGVWSRLVGEVFLDWLSPGPGQHWIDIGCGNGAFTELLSQRCAPAEIVGIDPSPGQLDFARSRHAAGIARFEQGSAMALPCDDDTFDAAVMALVIFFVPEPGKGIAEMKRVVRPGGSISAYAWDVLEPGGFPMAALQEELQTMGITPMLPPRADVSRIDALYALWADAGLIGIETRAITVSRTFEDFEDYWASAEIAIGMGQGTSAMGPEARAHVKDRLRMRLATDSGGRINFSARANVIVGYVPS